MMFLVIGGVNAQVIFPYGETFKNATATGIILGAGGISNPAVLTGTGTLIDDFTDPIGSGYLRLTNAAANQAGFARSDKKFPSRYGVTVNFEYYTFNPLNPAFTADGLSFFLFDATAFGAFNIGGFGGSLGYAQRNTPTQVPGVSKGFIGVGFDEFGNFATASEGRQGGNTNNDANNRSNVSLRGDGDGDALIGTNYEFLTHTRTTGEDGPVDGNVFPINGNVNGRDNGITGLTPLMTGYRKAKIEIIPVDLANNPDTISAPTRYKVNVWVTTGAPGGAVEHRVINDYIYTPSSAVPDSLSYGFAAATGGYQNYHEIRGLDIVAPSVFEFRPVLADVAVTGNEDATYTFTASDFQTSFLDPNGTTTLTEIRIESLPSNGVLKVGASAITTVPQTILLANIPTITFEPNVNWNGTSSFTWSGKDATSYATTSKAVNITINSVNDAPVGVDSSISVLQNANNHPITNANFGFTDPNDVTPGPANTFNGVKITAIPGLGTLKLDNVAVTAGQDITLADITANKLTYTPVAAGASSPYTTFTFQVLDNGGTTNGGVALDQSANTMTINVAPTPTITTTSTNPVICFGTASANISYSSTTGTPKPNRYSIDFVSGIPDVVDGVFDGTVGGTISVTGLAAIAGGTYNGTLTVRNSANGVVSAGTAVSIVINPLPGVGMAVSDPTICSGATATITLNSSVVGINYQLRLDAGNTNVGAVVAGTGGDITFSVSPTTTTTYNVLATNATTSCSAMVTDKPIVTVNPLPGVGMAVSDATICSGATATITLSNSVAGINYQLRLDSDNSLVGAVVAGTGGNITFSASPTSTTTYNVLATNATTSCSAMVTDKPIVTVLTTGQPSAISGLNNVCIGATGVTYSVTNESGHSYTWTYSGTGQTITGGTGTNSITVSYSSSATSGNWSVTATNTTTGCVSAARTYAITVGSTPQPGTMTTPAGTICKPAIGLIYSVPAVANTSYNWTYSGTGATITVGGGTASITVSYAANATNGTWSAVATDAGGCSSIPSTHNVVLTAAPATTISYPSGSFCPIGTTSVTHTGTTGGAYTSTTGLAINSTTGLIDLANSTPGTYTVTYTVTSGGCTATATNTVTINPLPTIAAITGSTGTTVGSTTPFASTTTGGTWSSNNTAIATVNPTTGIVTGIAAGTAIITYTVISGGCTGSVNKSITVAAVVVNTPPVIDVIPKVGEKDTPVAFTSADFTSKYTDTTPLSKIKIETLPPTGTLKLNGVNITVNQEISAAELPNITYVPVSGFTGGPVTFKWNGSDGTDYAIIHKDVSIVIYARPIAVADSFNTTKGGTLTVNAPGVLINDSDPDGQSISAIKVSDPANGTLTFNVDGSFTYIHNNGPSTTDSFTYKVYHASVIGNTVTVTINIFTGNIIPIIADITKSGFVNQTILFTSTDFTSKFADPNGSPLSKIRVVSLPSTGTLKLNGVNITANQEISLANLGLITYVPVTGFIGGPVSFIWNGSNGSDYATTNKNVNISITATNNPPLAVADSYTTTKGGTLTIAAPGVLTNDTDSEGNAITAIKVTDPANGTLTLNTNGSFTYIHTNLSTSTDSFTYKVNDGTSDGNTVTVLITLLNSPPIVSNIIKTSTGFTPIPFTVNDFTSKFTDSNGDPLFSVRISTLPLNGTLKLNGVPVTVNQVIPVAALAGLSFEPALNWSGTTNFTWNGSDGDVFASSPANVAITVSAPTDPNAKIGLAKNLASATPVLNGTYDVKFVFTAVNFGPNGLGNISIKDNLALAFGGSDVIIKTITAFGNLRANTLFNGSTDTELLQPASRLLAGEEAKVELLINVRLVTTSGVFQNTATAEASSSVNGFKVRDVSTNGLRPDPNTAADVSPAETTPIKLDLLPAYVPAGFSPNGDGTNDKFVVQNANGKQVSLEMYNRWGNRVYKSEDYKNDWGGEVTEGFFLGRDIPDGTYYYIIIIDKKDKYTGFITVNR